jgi:hypothetical protein
MSLTHLLELAAKLRLVKRLLFSSPLIVRSHECLPTAARITTNKQICMYVSFLEKLRPDTLRTQEGWRDARVNLHRHNHHLQYSASRYTNPTNVRNRLKCWEQLAMLSRPIITQSPRSYDTLPPTPLVRRPLSHWRLSLLCTESQQGSVARALCKGFVTQAVRSAAAQNSRASDPFYHIRVR